MVPICVALLIITSFVVAHYCARGQTSTSLAGSELGKRKSESSYEPHNVRLGWVGHVGRVMGHVGLGKVDMDLFYSSHMGV